MKAPVVFILTGVGERFIWNRNSEEVVDNKRQVYEEGYGWKEKAQAAKRVIDRTA